MVWGKIVTAGVRADRNDGRNCMCKELRFLLMVWSERLFWDSIIQFFFSGIADASDIKG